jgi:hypothetical protein
MWDVLVSSFLLVATVFVSNLAYKVAPPYFSYVFLRVEVLLIAFLWYLWEKGKSGEG